MADMPKLKYRVVTGFKPGTSTVVLRPQIVERETYYNDQVVEFALKGGYVRGQFEEMKQLLNGYIHAAQELSNAGYSVNFADWYRIHAELTGQVGTDRQLTAANALNVNITALQKLKVSVSDFSWTNVDDTGVIMKIDALLTPNGENGKLVKGSQILMTGKNLTQLDGDTVKATAAGMASPVTLTVVESDYAHVLCAWNAAFDNVAAGTEITVTIASRAGIVGGAIQYSTKTATLVAA